MEEEKNSKQRKFPWHIVGPMIAVAGLAYAIYSNQSNKKYSEITFQELSTTSVIEINERLPELKIMYKEKDLLSTDEEININEYRIENTGTINIKQGDYEPNTNWGIEFNNCRLLIEPEIKAASADYVGDNFKKLITDSLGRILFPKSLFDSRDYVDIKLLTIKKRAENSEMKLFGKISGINNWKYRKN